MNFYQPPKGQQVSQQSQVQHPQPPPQVQQVQHPQPPPQVQQVQPPERPVQRVVMPQSQGSQHQQPGPQAPPVVPRPRIKMARPPIERDYSLPQELQGHELEELAKGADNSIKEVYGTTIVRGDIPFNSINLVQNESTFQKANKDLVDGDVINRAGIVLCRTGEAFAFYPVAFRPYLRIREADGGEILGLIEKWQHNGGFEGQHFNSKKNAMVNVIFQETWTIYGLLVSQIYQKGLEMHTIKCGGTKLQFAKLLSNLSIGMKAAKNFPVFNIFTVKRTVKDRKDVERTVYTYEYQINYEESKKLKDFLALPENKDVLTNILINQRMVLADKYAPLALDEDVVDVTNNETFMDA